MAYVYNLLLLFSARKKQASTSSAAIMRVKSAIVKVWIKSSFKHNDACFAPPNVQRRPFKEALKHFHLKNSSSPRRIRCCQTGLQASVNRWQLLLSSPSLFIITLTDVRYGRRFSYFFLEIHGFIPMGAEFSQFRDPNARDIW